MVDIGSVTGGRLGLTRPGDIAVEQVLATILGLSGILAYVVVALLAFGEAAAFVGLLVPGEIAVVLGGVLASQGRVSLSVLLVTVAVAAIAGDSAGYEIGRRWGGRLLDSRLARRHAVTIRNTQRYMRERGATAVFLGRWTSVLRAIVPALAGASHMPYRRFLVANVVGGIAWAVAFTMAGYLAGESYRYVESALGWGSWALTGVLVALFGVGWAIRRRRRTRAGYGVVAPTGHADDHDGPGESASARSGTAPAGPANELRGTRRSS